LIACGGFGWPPKKAEKHIDAESKIAGHIGPAVENKELELVAA